MNKTLYLIVISIIILFSSCTNDNNDNNPLNFELESGAFVCFENNEPELTYPDSQNILFSDTIKDANNNVSNYILTLTATVAGEEHTIEYFSTTTFPATLNITSQNIADALNLEVSALSFGDTFTFTATAERNDGEIFNGESPIFNNQELTVNGGNTDDILLTGSGFKDAMNFTIIVSCPFIQSEIIGEYTVINDFWEDYEPGDQITIVAGEQNNTYRILADRNLWIDNASENLWIEVTVDMITGASTALSNEAFIYTDWKTLEVSAQEGLTLSCNGLISLELDFTEEYAGNNLTLQKN